MKSAKANNWSPNKWPVEDKVDVQMKIILFVISPFISFLYSLKTPNRKSSFIVGFLFCIFFGMAFTVGNVRNDNSLDGITYRIGFEEYVGDSELTYYAGLEDFLSFQGETKDYYFDTVAFLVSRFTSNYHVMFMIFAIIFAFFMYNSLKILTEDEYFRCNLVCLLLIVIFGWNQIFNINGVRFWTAAWVATYAALQIFYKGKNGYFLLALITPFIHGSYWFFLIILGIAFFFRRFKSLWTILFCVSTFVSSFAVDILDMTAEYIPSFLQKTVAYYTDEMYMHEVANAGQAIDSFFRFTSRLYVNLLVIMLILGPKPTKEHDKSLYGFLLVYMSIVNFYSLIPSLGNRFLMVALPFVGLMWLRVYKGVYKNVWLYVFPLFFMLDIYQLFKYKYFVVLDWTFYISSPFKIIFDYLL